MLVYGDAHFTGHLQPLRRQLLHLAGQAAALPPDLDRLRSLLIACGQVEQAAHDALDACLPPGEAAPLIAHFHAATAAAAEAFYTLAWRQPAALPAPQMPASQALQTLRAALQAAQHAPDLAVTVKLPEGFSLHALYPEQYLAAAGRWLAGHAAQRPQGAVVVGVRSIGATLAAAVSTVLRAAGWQVTSFTVRPVGHPFGRQVTLDGLALEPEALGLVVDEGPGISGSSLAATAAALVAVGLQRRNIAFLPGHANGPGGAGSEEVQSWWRSTPCYVAEHTAITFGGLPLRQALAQALPEPVVQWEDLSGGVWRQSVYASAGDWPPICTAFERVKLRCTLASGRQVLFKFMGLAALSPDLTSSAQAAAALLAQRAAQGLAPPPLAAAFGFVATEWTPGAPLLPQPGNETALFMAPMLGDYIARVAGPPLAADELAAATARLREMLYANTHEALGEEAAARARHLHSPLADGATGERRSYGDGHLGPHEWIMRHGAPFKVDGVGHDCDHTLIGKQPVCWDLAGALVEWQLDAAARAQLLAAYDKAGGAAIDPGALHFYHAAYLAFRAGQCSLAAQVHDPYERDRLWGAYEHYRSQLDALLHPHSNRF